VTLVIRVWAHANSPETRLLGASGAGARSLVVSVKFRTFGDRLGRVVSVKFRTFGDRQGRRKVLSLCLG
jgi:hypothetical protein